MGPTMRGLFQAALGLTPPWRVVGSDFDAGSLGAGETALVNAVIDDACRCGFNVMLAAPATGGDPTRRHL
jgi:hypothetical protein